MNAERPKALTALHGLSLVATSYFLVATSEVSPPRKCFENVTEGGTYEVSLTELAEGYDRAIPPPAGTGGSAFPDLGGLAGADAGGAVAEPPSPPALVPGRSCTGIDGLDTGGSFRMRIGEEQAGNSQCIGYTAQLLDGVPHGLVATFDEARGYFQSELTGLGASVTTDPSSACLGRWELSVYAEPAPRDGLVDPTAPGATRFHVHRTIHFPQVHFCEGLLDPSVRGEFTCRDAWSVAIVEAP